MKRKSLRVIVTAGPTLEPLDRVRFLSNHATGAFGYRLAEHAAQRGHRVTLVSGPTYLRRPKGVAFFSITTARHLKDTLTRLIPRADALIMTAAVADFRPAVFSAGKIKRSKKISLTLVANPDILKSLARHKKGRVFIGCCVEPCALIARARAKLKEKSLDMIVGFLVDKHHAPFGEKKASCIILDNKGACIKVHSRDKRALSGIVIKKLESLREKKEKTSAW